MRSLGHPFVKVFLLDDDTMRELRPPRGETWFVQKLMVDNPFTDQGNGVFVQNFIAKLAVTDNTTSSDTVTEFRLGDQVLPNTQTMVASKDINAWTFLDSLHALRLQRQSTTATVKIGVQLVMTKADPNVIVIPKALYTLTDESDSAWIFSRKPLETTLVGLDESAFLRQTSLALLKTLFKQDTVNTNIDEWIFVKLTDDSDRAIVPVGAV